MPIPNPGSSDRSIFICFLSMPFSPRPADWKICNFLKKDSNTGAFLWISRNFYERLFWRTSMELLLLLNGGFHQILKATTLLKNSVEELLLQLSEAYPEPFQTYKKERFTKIDNGWKELFFNYTGTLRKIWCSVCVYQTYQISNEFIKALKYSLGIISEAYLEPSWTMVLFLKVVYGF